MGKEDAQNNTAYGREGLLLNPQVDSAGFYFVISDISANGNNIEFNELKDTSSVNNIDEMNEYLTTVPFQISDNSILMYNLQYGLINPDAPLLINEGNMIRLRVELVDDATNEVLDIFNNLTFNEINQPEYEINSFSISTLGIGNRMARIRLVSEDNIYPLYSLASIYVENEIIAKTNINQLTYNGGQVVTKYDLVQNYPNPFNPSTTINYQIPNDGFVTLKIYDALGREVNTLVNEFKTTGRYEVNFDASSLASGVYIYSIKSGSFTASKKMILAK